MIDYTRTRQVDYFLFLSQRPPASRLFLQPTQHGSPVSPSHPHCMVLYWLSQLWPESELRSAVLYFHQAVKCSLPILVQPARHTIDVIILQISRLHLCYIRVCEVNKLRTDKRWSSQFCMQRCRKQYKTDKKVGKRSIILTPCNSNVSSQTAIQLRPMNHSAHAPVPKFTTRSIVI